VSVGCVAGIMLDVDLAGVGEIFLAMVALHENPCTFVLRCNRTLRVRDLLSET